MHRYCDELFVFRRNQCFLTIFNYLIVFSFHSVLHLSSAQPQCSFTVPVKPIHCHKLCTCHIWYVSEYVHFYRIVYINSHSNRSKVQFLIRCKWNVNKTLNMFYKNVHVHTENSFVHNHGTMLTSVYSGKREVHQWQPWEFQRVACCQKIQPFVLWCFLKYLLWTKVVF